MLGIESRSEPRFEDIASLGVPRLISGCGRRHHRQLQRGTHQPYRRGYCTRVVSSTPVSFISFHHLRRPSRRPFRGDEKRGRARPFSPVPKNPENPRKTFGRGRDRASSIFNMRSFTAVLSEEESPVEIERPSFCRDPVGMEEAQFRALLGQYALMPQPPQPTTSEPARPQARSPR